MPLENGTSANVSHLFTNKGGLRLAFLIRTIMTRISTNDSFWENHKELLSEASGRIVMFDDIEPDYVWIHIRSKEHLDMCIEKNIQIHLVQIPNKNGTFYLSPRIKVEFKKIIDSL